MKKRKLLVLIIIVFSTLLSSFLFYGYQIISTPNLRVKKEPKFLFIHNDMTFKDLQKTLIEGEYVNDLISFSFIAKLMKYQENVKPGKFLIDSDMTNREAISMLRLGEQYPVKVTFNNIRLLTDLAGKITRNLSMDSSAFAQFILMDSLHNIYEFDKESFIGMFLPNTYESYWNITPSKLVLKMNREYNKFWNKDRLAKAAELDMSPKEISVLASIVEAETKMMDEAPVIAGLYLNRLKRGMLLQADPTLVFAHQDFEIRRVLNKHKTIDSPYNTYKYKGLPPGPINMPSIKAIEAVLNYQRHNYIFFCAKEDFSGYHNFAETHAQHVIYAKRYQKELNKAGIYN